MHGYFNTTAIFSFGLLCLISKHFVMLSEVKLKIVTLLFTKGRITLFLGRSLLRETLQLSTVK